VVSNIEPGGNGFIRGMLRGLARDRYVHGVGSEPAFRLIRWSDGRHSITDTATGTVLHLAAFGFDNVKEFAKLLTVGQQATATLGQETRK
jgi:putative photosynthetic complex assembly protein